MIDQNIIFILNINIMNPLTILVTPVHAVGHVNACAGALSSVLSHGHRVIFLIEEAFKGKLSPLGFEECVYQLNPKNTEQPEKEEKPGNPGEAIAKQLMDNKVLGDFTVWEKMSSLSVMFHEEKSFQEIEIQNERIKDAIGEFKPDLLYFDGPWLYPAIPYSGIPWVKHNSLTPATLLFLDSGEVPPGFSGFPSNGSLTEYREFNKVRRELHFSKQYQHFIRKLDYELFPEDNICPDMQNLTVYGYPEEINYPYVRTLGWFNLEVFNKAPTEKRDLDQLVPETFLSDTLDGKYSGKLVYLSMGSVGSADLDLMKRLVRILGSKNNNHKYIVSKGPRHSEFDLPSRNMYGDRYLPQTAILPHVDLVITHGGNNTVTETFAAGKPKLFLAILPLFGDQFDNAQRLQETGYGLRLEPYRFTDEELTKAVDQLLGDQELKLKMEKAAQRIQNEDKHEELVKKLEELVTKL